MADAPTDFLNVIEDIQKNVFSTLDQVSKTLSELDTNQLSIVARELDFLQELDRQGYNKALNNLMSKYDDEVVNVFREARARGVETSVASVRSLELLKELDTTTLLGKAQEFSTTLKSELLKGIIAGESSEIIVERLQRTVTTLTTAQTRLVVNDSFARFSNSAKFKAFEDLPQTKYQYVGPNDSKTREACANVLNNPQTAEGFTVDAINSLDGVGQADRGGFNCRHEWEVVL